MVFFKEFKLKIKIQKLYFLIFKILCTIYKECHVQIKTSFLRTRTIFFTVNNLANNFSENVDTSKFERVVFFSHLTLRTKDYISIIVSLENMGAMEI